MTLNLELTEQANGTYYFTANGRKSCAFKTYGEMKKGLKMVGIVIPNKSKLKWFSSGWFEKYAFVTD